MFIARLHVKNYRCFKDTVVDFQPGLNVIIGENNSGKTTLLKALALVFASRRSKRPRIHDFNRMTGCSVVPPSIEVSVTLRSCEADTVVDRGLVAAWLTKIEKPWEATLTYSFALPEQDRPEFEKALGKKPDKQRFFDAIEEVLPRYVARVYAGNRDTQLQVDRELLAKFDCQFLDALRDVESEMFSGSSPLLNTMLKEVLDISVDEKKILTAKSGFRKKSKALRDGLLDRLDTSQLFDLVEKTGAADGGKPELDGGIQESDILSALRLYINNENFSFPATHQGLGYNNLIYISLMMASMSFRTSARRGENAATFPMLLIEEPEAHLHPALQYKLLSHIVGRLSDGTNASRQVFVTTHSTHVTSAVGLEPIICLAQGDVGDIRASYPAKLFPDTLEGQASKGYVARYLDATKATMLFAKGIILVEGIAEQMILPAIASRLEQAFDESHVSVIRVDGLTFKHFLPLFGIGTAPKFSNQHLNRKVACIVDGDPTRKLKNVKKARWTSCMPFQIDKDKSEYDYKRLSSVATSLSKASETHETVGVFYGTKTLEYDLALANAHTAELVSTAMRCNADLVKLAGAPGKLPSKIKNLFNNDELEAIEAISQEDEKQKVMFAAAYLKCALKCKGEHAFAVEMVIRDTSVEFQCPPYIKKAISWATDNGRQS